VQLTPPGSACSIQLGTSLTDAPAGSLRNSWTPVGAWDGGFAPGLDRNRGDYASFAGFADPDGNTWLLQERGFHQAA
jgi:hypothetical protein